VVEGRVISIKEIQQLEYPIEGGVISKIMFLLNAPAQRIALALNALPRNVACDGQRSHQGKQFWVRAGPVRSQVPHRLPK